ncbi:MAG: hypothetical protein ACRED9_01575 [Caulobacteraceae bacterium]
MALPFYRLQQIDSGAIDLADGDAPSLKGPTDVGTAVVRDGAIPLSTLVDRLNERFGTDFTAADQLFFDQILAGAEEDEEIVEAARANNLENFSSLLDRELNQPFIDWMDGNEEVFQRVMSDPAFQALAHRHLAEEIFRRARDVEPSPV